ncbi:helix-turn-helix domain-containing protein [Streptomyces gardneri]|uniref:helix-turn-helix domain-containing protein n=1 Tax=Streptomyces gardneri TaxID=66892 RepID=UPI0033E8129A
MSHWRAQRPACLHGHPFPENLRIDTRGWALCITCQRSAYPPATPDEIAVDRAVMGEPPARLTPRERQAAVQRLDRRGLTARQIAECIGCTPRTVHRIRNRAAA